MTDCTPSISSAALADLVRLGRSTGADLLGTVIDCYLDDSSRRVELLHRSLAERDAPAAAAAAHALAGSSSILGARTLSELCRAVESAARAGNLALGTSLCAGLDGAARQVARDLLLFREEPPGDSADPGP